MVNILKTNQTNQPTSQPNNIFNTYLRKKEEYAFLAHAKNDIPFHQEVFKLGIAKSNNALKLIEVSEYSSLEAFQNKDKEIR